MDSGVSVTRLDPEGAEYFQRLRADLGVESFGLNLIRLRPGRRGRVHRHERQEEVYLVLDGTLTLELGPDHARDLGVHELARVGPAERRRLVNRTREPVVVLAIGGSSPHEGRDGVAWTDWEEPGDGRAPADVPMPPDLEV